LCTYDYNYDYYKLQIKEVNLSIIIDCKLINYNQINRPTSADFLRYFNLEAKRR